MAVSRYHLSVDEAHNPQTQGHVLSTKSPSVTSPPPSPRIQGVFSNYYNSFFPKTKRTPSEPIPVSQNLVRQDALHSNYAPDQSYSYMANGCLKPETPLPPKSPKSPLSPSQLRPQNSLSSPPPCIQKSPSPSLYHSFIARTASLISSRSQSLDSSPPDSPQLSPPPLGRGGGISPARARRNIYSANRSSEGTSSSGNASVTLQSSTDRDGGRQRSNDSNNNSSNNATSTSVVGGADLSIITTTRSTSQSSESERVVEVKPPTSVVNVNPRSFQLLNILHPRNITIEHVVFSHK